MSAYGIVKLREFIKENNIKTAADIQNALKEMFKDTLQEMLEAELDDSLGYVKKLVVLNELKNQGVNDILIISVDNLPSYML